MLTPEEVKELKSQLVEQVKHLEGDKRKQALEQIESLSPQALELMIKEQQSKEKKSNKGIFRLIADKEIPSKIIEENSVCIAVLDIKPISKGHTLIIPKKAISDAKLIPSQCFTLAKKIASRVSKKLKAKGSEIQTEFKFGEIIINLIPVYEKPVSLQSTRTSPSEKELEEVHSLLRIIKKSPIKRAEKPKIQSSSNIIHLPRRIP